MVLTFTGSMRVVDPSEERNAILWGAIGCNFAWGFVDAVMYLMATFITRARGLRTLKAVRTAVNPDAARRLIADALPGPVVDVMTTAEIDTLLQRLMARPEPVAFVRIRGRDLLAAAGVFLLVFFSTFPVVIPFFASNNVRSALFVSNVIAVAMLYVAGWSLGNYAGRPGWRTGIGMVVVGIVLVGTTMALGG